MADVVEQAVLSGQYATKSEFFRTLIRAWSEQRLLQDLEISHLEMARGKKTKLVSLKDLR